MSWNHVIRVVLIGSIVTALCSAAVAKEPYQYFRMGAKTDVSTRTTAGFALMGGGKDLDPAFQWMCKKSGGGDFLILRANGSDAYNDYVNKMCHQNSIATLVIGTKEAAMDPFVATTIRHAEALFIAGGDQANYIRNWKDTPVQDAINDLIHRHVPVGGTSAGLAVLGQFSYSALGDRDNDPNLNSKETLADPYFDRVTITRDFLKVDLLRNTITDTHFAKRDRLGRLLVFMARIVQDKLANHVRGIGVDERSAALLEADGSIKVVGSGLGAYFFDPAQKPSVCAKGKPLTYEKIAVYRVAPGATFNLNDWIGSGGTSYSLQVAEGEIRSTTQDHTIYGTDVQTSAAIR
jgi:cyanophycinase